MEFFVGWRYLFRRRRSRLVTLLTLVFLGLAVATQIALFGLGQTTAGAILTLPTVLLFIVFLLLLFLLSLLTLLLLFIAVVSFLSFHVFHFLVAIVMFTLVFLWHLLLGTSFMHATLFHFKGTTLLSFVATGRFLLLTFTFLIVVFIALLFTPLLLLLLALFLTILAVFIPSCVIIG